VDLRSVVPVALDVPLHHAFEAFRLKYGRESVASRAAFPERVRKASRTKLGNGKTYASEEKAFEVEREKR